MISTSFCKYLHWDSNFFGCRIGRIEEKCLNDNNINQILKWSKEHHIDCLYYLCPPNDDRSVTIAESKGFHLVDVRIELSSSSRQYTAGGWRKYEESDLNRLIEIASNAYTDSRFYHDGHFDRNKVSELYCEWIRKSCCNPAGVVMVSEQAEGIAGFITCEIEGTHQGRIGLLGVDKNFRGIGIGQKLVQAAQDYFFTHQIDEIKVVTQGRNVAAQRLYQMYGFKTLTVDLWYHLWF